MNQHMQKCIVKLCKKSRNYYSPSIYLFLVYTKNCAIDEGTKMNKTSLFSPNTNYIKWVITTGSMIWGKGREMETKARDPGKGEMRGGCPEVYCKVE